MQKLLLIISLSFIAIGLMAQVNKDFSTIDAYARKAPEHITSSISLLSEYLTEPYDNELDKARSIFAWITHHIDYDKKAYNDENLRINKSNEDVLRRRKAVCYGYATLFKALCEAANISAEIVSGYSKRSMDAISELGEVSHAWNTVKIEEKWYLLDATWSRSLESNIDDVLSKTTTYFLSKPETFILNHLPTDPMWQLLDCPVTADIFIKNGLAIKSYLDTNQDCVDYTDTLAQFEKLTYAKKLLISEERAYRFYPTEVTARNYGHALMDYRQELAEIAETLQGSAYIDSLIEIQKEMIQLCEKATQLTTLFPNQIENCAYVRINYAVALSQKANDVSDTELTSIYEIMKKQTLLAKKTLEKLPSNFMVQYGLEQCKQILDYLE